MAAVTIHLPRDVEERVRQASSAAGVSVSAWLTAAARRVLDEKLPPPELTRWFGAFPDLDLPTRRETWSKEP